MKDVQAFCYDFCPFPRFFSAQLAPCKGSLYISDTSAYKINLKHLKYALYLCLIKGRPQRKSQVIALFILVITCFRHQSEGDAEGTKVQRREFRSREHVVKMCSTTEPDKPGDD